MERRGSYFVSSTGGKERNSKSDLGKVEEEEEEEKEEYACGLLKDRTV